MKGWSITVREQLVSLRKAMQAHGVDCYLIPSGDFHASEYAGKYFGCRAYVSGFTGSAGTLVVTADWAGLWTDGRYFLQAGQQLSGSGIDLCRMGEPGVPTISDWLAAHLQAGQVFGFDGRTVSTRQYQAYKKLMDSMHVTIACEMDLVGEIWADRPAMSAEPVFELAADVVGQSRASKLANLRRDLKAAGADAIVMSSLMDICWLFNIRGNDVACTPVVLTYAAVTAEKAELFISSKALTDDVRGSLSADGVTFREYGDVYAYVKAIAPGTRVMMNLNVINSTIYAGVPDGVIVLDHVDPTELPKACKNAAEVANMRLAHVKDGVAVTRLMYWLKQNVGKVPMDELSVAAKLDTLREEQENYLGRSFGSIIAYGAHGAIVHYGPTEASNIPVEPRSFLLADTGGHYLEGTTDITRTFAMGELTEEEKRLYTLVLKGHLRLGAARFKYGCTGSNLDILARQPLWDAAMDYNHGTGHGVGYILSVHEGPQSIRWKQLPGHEAAVLEPGMITSDEPGIYLEGKFGVRLENLTVVVEDETNAYGRFLRFEHLTMVPWDLDAVVPELMNEDERRMLNAYHAQVRAALTPRLNAEEAAWLAEATREI